MWYRPWTKCIACFSKTHANCLFTFFSNIRRVSMPPVHTHRPPATTTTSQPTDYQTTIFPAPIGHCQKFDLYGFFEGQILQELPLSPTSSGAL